MSLIRKIVLYPFAIILDFLTSIRNFFFDVGIFKEHTFHYFSIGVGNISLGGTGKSVLVSYLAEILNDKYKINILSRGYGRKSSGFQIANKSSTPNHLGDEPYMFYKQNKKIRVAVCNSRREGISRLIESINKKLKNIFILDDLYQHRWVKPNIMILLTEYSKPYFKDYLFPSGNLRESRKSASRADIIIVTKCPRDLSVDQKEIFISELNVDLKQKVSNQKNKLNEISSKFKEIKSLAIQYKENKDKEIKKLNDELDSFKKTIEENNTLYESMLDKTTQSLEKIISNSESLSKIQ